METICEMGWGCLGGNVEGELSVGGGGGIVGLGDVGGGGNVEIPFNVYSNIQKIDYPYDNQH